MAQVPTAYNCRQSELYTVCNLGWAAFAANIAAFTAFSSFYDATLLAARLQVISNAQHLPDYQARNSIAETAREALAIKNAEALNAMQRLKRYITYWAAPQDVSSYLDAAGMTYYLEASNLNWDSAAQMLSSADNFVTQYSVDLQNNNNMPAVFALLVGHLKADFDSLHTDFLTKKQDAMVATENKIIANNQIYYDLVAMFADAKLLGFSDATMKKFTFAILLQLISNVPTAGVSGVVTDSATGNIISGASVEIANNGLNTVSGTDGSYSFTGLGSGTYNIIVSANGYINWTGSVTLSAGSSGILNIQLSI